MSSATVGLIKPPVVGGNVVGVAPAPMPPVAPGQVKKRRKKAMMDKPMGKPIGKPRMGGKTLADTKPGQRSGMKPMQGMKSMMDKNPMSEITGGAVDKKEIY